MVEDEHEVLLVGRWLKLKINGDCFRAIIFLLLSTLPLFSGASCYKGLDNIESLMKIRKIRVYDIGERNGVPLKWLTDDKIFFHSHCGSIDFLDLKNGEVINVVNYDSQVVNIGVVSPDGQKLLYSVLPVKCLGINEVPSEQELKESALAELRRTFWICNLLNHQCQVITKGLIDNLVWAPDGDRLAFCKTVLAEDKWEAEIKSHTVRQIKVRLNPKEPPEYQIWLTNDDGSGKRKLIGDGIEKTALKFSSDSQFITFLESLPESGKVFLAKLDIRSGKVQTTPMSEHFEPKEVEWFLNSDEVVTYVDEKKRKLMFHNIKSKKRAGLPLGHFEQGYFSLSPDGRQVAFLKRDNLVRENKICIYNWGKEINRALKSIE